jgi:magnesium transporter
MTNYKKISDKIQQLIINNPKNNSKLTWINITDAKTDEIEYLRKKYKYDLNDLRLSMSTFTSQRPIIEQRDKYLFLILHFPYFNGENMKSSEIDFFINSTNLVTMHSNNITILNDFFNYCKKDSESLLAYQFESPEILLYEILSKIVLSGYELLDKNSIAITEIEKIIFEEIQKKAVSKILLLKRNIINIRKIMQNHKNIFKRLAVTKSKTLSKEKMKEYYHKLIEHTKTFWEILDNQKEMIEALDKTNESLMNYTISDIMKTLTIFSVIVFPLTLFAAIFGMNITGSMPLLNNPHGFWIIAFIMSCASLLMLLFFERKKWL